MQSGKKIYSPIIYNPITRDSCAETTTSVSCGAGPAARASLMKENFPYPVLSYAGCSGSLSSNAGRLLAPLESKRHWSELVQSMRRSKCSQNSCLRVLSHWPIAMGKIQTGCKLCISHLFCKRVQSGQGTTTPLPINLFNFLQSTQKQ